MATRARKAPHGPPLPPGERERIGGRIAARRDAAGLSVVALAAAAGLTEGAVRQLERAAVNPGLGTLYALAAALNCHPADLLRDPPLPAKPARRKKPAD